MSTENTYRMQCGNSNSKTSVIKAPESMKITCPGGKSVVSPDTNCKVECETGGPNYADIHCKAAGWRPTNEIKCEGVSPGVIIGVLIAGIAAVVVIAIGYAKYRQHVKRKNGNNFKVQTGKINPNSSRQRPGKVIGPPTADDKPKPKTYPSSEADSSRTKTSWKNDSRKSKPPSYNEVESRPGANGVHHKSNMGDQATPDVPPHDRKEKRGQQRKSQGGDYNHGYNHHGYQYDDPRCSPQIGYNNQAYYQGQQGGYGYAAHQEPTVGYSAMAHPQTYPSGRDYSGAYNVQT